MSLDPILADISADEMWRHLEALCRWDRTTGTAGEFAAVDYVAEVLRGYGLPVTMHEYRAYISHPVAGGLVARLGGERVPIRAKTRAFSASTPPEGVTGALVSIRGGTNMFRADNAVNEISPETVGGRIVLSESGSRATMLAAMRAGALGYVHMWPSDEDVIHEGIVTPVWGTPTPETAGNIPTFPLVSITNGDGNRLREALRGGPVEATLTAETRTAWTTVRMPVTHIPGASDDFVLVAGHIDSWHYGATDNATGNVACLELARVFHRHRERLRRGVRIAWWVGHSTGRYSGSTWYADNHFAELDRQCVAYINIDSPGSLGATDYSEVSAVPATARLVTEAVRALTGQTPAIERPMRAGDQSFWGIGVPSLFMLLSNRPEGQRAAVGGCGMGWWWHAEEDLIDKADPEVLLLDTRIYAHALLRLATEEVLPLDVAGEVAELLAIARELAAAAEGHVELSPVVEALEELGAVVGALCERPADERNSIAKAVSHRLTALSFTSGNRFDHDAAMPLPTFPALDGARRIASLDPAGDAYGFLATRLVRNRNLVLHEIAAALDACRPAA